MEPSGRKLKRTDKFNVQLSTFSCFTLDNLFSQRVMISALAVDDVYRVAVLIQL
jgi:hypothetical protein